MTNGDGVDWKAVQQEALRQTEIDNVLKDGKVYIGADDLAKLLAQAASMTVYRSMVTGVPAVAYIGEGLGIAGDFVRDMGSELLRREADAMLRASEDI